jgi:hypothetical protein
VWTVVQIMVFPLFQVHIPGMWTILIQESNFLYLLLYHSNKAGNTEGNNGAQWGDVDSIIGIAIYATACGVRQGLSWLSHVTHWVYF